ncbi:MAG: Ig-like domain-containing protein [Candidatus Zixiibacteriota bacterium]
MKPDRIAGSFPGILLILLILLSNCAEVAAPPGGEEDKKAPFLIQSNPVNGAVNVPLSDRIELKFSEPLVEPSSGTPIYISPRFKDEVKIKWKTDRVIIELPDSFKTDQTYIITMAPTVTDLRRNPVDNSVAVAFSTGSFIDTGKIAGVVYTEGKPQSGAIMALYDLALFPDSIPYDSVYPDYMSSTDPKGAFAFSYLPPRNFRLVAFIDKNRDERFNPYRENFALPDREINLEGNLPLDNLLMTMTAMDTSRVAIISAVINPDNLLRVRLTKDIELDRLKNDPSQIILNSQADTTRRFPARSFLEASQLKARTLNVLFDSLSRDVYQLRLNYEIDRPPLEFENLELNYLEDKLPPTITEFQPGDKPVFSNEAKIGFIFSEPLQTNKITGNTFLLWESDTLPVALERTWVDEFRLSLIPAQLIPGRKYRIDITEFEIIDRAANVMGDSLVTYAFSLLDMDSLGSISGKVAITLSEKTDHPVKLFFDQVGGKQSFQREIENDEFRLDVPAGKYLLSGFIDSDKNGEKNHGTIIPYRPAETMAFYPDTISVRARFETAEILFEFK